MPFKTTKQRFYIVREDITGKDLVTKRVKVEVSGEELSILKDDEYIWAANHNLGVNSLKYKLAEKIRKVLG